MKEQTRRTTTEVLLHQVAVVQQVVAVQQAVTVVQQVAAVVLQAAAVVQQAVAAQPNQRNFVSTTKTRMEIGATRRQQRDGVLDCFERFDLFALF